MKAAIAVLCVLAVSYFLRVLRAMVQEVKRVPQPLLKAISAHWHDVVSGFAQDGRPDHDGDFGEVLMIEHLYSEGESVPHTCDAAVLPASAREKGVIHEVISRRHVGNIPVHFIRPHAASIGQLNGRSAKTSHPTGSGSE